MLKIKEINISNFRAYLGDHQFSFVGKNGISNLIVIYGPNGFGKTSLFDAVEFTLADSIRRFENKITQAEIDNQDYADGELRLLSNRYTEKMAEVSIVLEDNQQIKRTAKRWKHRGGPYTDYKKGILTTNLNGKALQSFYDTNLLSQDQIDSFLRLRTPEEKFSELKEFWPEGADAAEVFKKLAKYFRLLHTCLTETNKKIKDTKAEIAKFLNPDAKLNAIRKQIEALNKNTFYPLVYPELKAEINEEIYLRLIELNETNKKRISNRIAEFPALQFRIDSLQTGYPAYITNQSNLKAEEIKFNNLSEAKKKYNAFKNLQEQKTSNDHSSNELQSRLRSAESFIAEWPAHCENIALILHLIDENSTGLRRAEKALHQISTYAESEQALQYSLQDVRKNCSVAVQADNEMDALEAGLEKCERDLKDGLEILEYLEGEEAKLDHDIGILQEKRYLIQVVEQDYIADVIPAEFRYYQTNYLKNRENLKDITSTLTSLNTQRDLQDSFAERLDSILEWGLGQVKEQRLSTCPMCNTRFDNVTELIAGMQAERGTVLQTSALANQITEVLRIRLSLKEEEFLLECQMDELAAQLEEDLSKEINATFYDREQVYNRRADVESKVNYASSYSDRVIEELAEKGLPAEEFRGDFKGLRNFNEDRIIELKKAAERLESVIQFKIQRQQLLEIESTVNKLQQESNSNRIEMISTNQSFLSFQASLGRYQRKADEIHFEFLQALLDQLKASQQETIKTGGNLRHQLARLSAEQVLDSVTYLPEVSELQLMEMFGKINSLEEEIKAYRENYRLLIDDPEYSQDLITELDKSFKVRVNGYNELKDDLERFTIELEVIRENLKLNDLKDVLSDLNAKKKQTEVSKEKVRLAHNACGDFINDGIEQYFNKDVINRIYSKIEPHPNLKEIEIKSEITEGDKAAKLQIRAKNQNDRLNPIFYFSTGQVNVLSLSIFLAKAFELGGETINTIFMDDPVQNLSDINVLSFIDLLRTLIEEKDRQIVISTHDEKFFRLLQNKLSDEYFKAKYFELISYGQIKDAV